MLLQTISINDTIATDSDNNTTGTSPPFSPLSGIQIAYPDEWLVNDLGNGTVRFTSPLRTDLMRFTVNVVNLPSSMANMTLDNIVELNLNTSRQLLSNFSLIESNATTISSENQSAYRIVYTNTNKDPSFPLKFKTMQIFTMKDSQLYTLSYVSEASQYGRYLLTIENMIDSVTFSKDTSLQTTENNDLMFGPNIMRM
jgi:serine/threonine-protein kinase